MGFFILYLVCFILSLYVQLFYNTVFYTCEAAGGKDTRGVVWRRLSHRFLILLRKPNRNAVHTPFVSPMFVCYSNKVTGRCTSCNCNGNGALQNCVAFKNIMQQKKERRGKRTEAKSRVKCLFIAVGGQTTCLAAALNHLEQRSPENHLWVDQTTSWFLPVPPAIMPRCLAVLVSAGDFLSACTANTPASRTRSCWVIRSDSSRLNTSNLFTHTPAEGAHLCPCTPTDHWVPWSRWRHWSWGSPGTGSSSHPRGI